MNQKNERIGRVQEINRFPVKSVLGESLSSALVVGESVTLKIVAPLQRCIMVNNPQEELKQDARILKTLATNHAAMFGVWAKVERCGEIRVGDEAMLLE